ncbi:hypothetical protein PCCS19_16420 [Paenibacillus sp. CCS19]|uniref:non-ribosomal peptide synthetase n=1 Tax=Paenibacillus sp. CCS19 TaxID=3158387 RepID=UPI002563EC6C|nr:non-ribosomal peptide synthetase [Paenibacillus cellulosilyticus]GMK38588.1 hypothetical protein PCCS19_16420 [Paenibacillus cellulosilyticus]
MVHSLVEVLRANSQLSERFITFIWGSSEEKRVSFSTFYDHVMKVLYRLQARGLKPGDEVILQIEHEEHFLYAFWACIAGGIIPVPVSTGANDEHRLKLYKVWETMKSPYVAIEDKWWTKLMENEVAGYSAESLRTGLLPIEQLVDGLDDELPHGRLASPKREDIAFIQFSSGSTGTPKGVMLTHDNLLCNAEAMISRIELTDKDTYLSWMPLTHDMGLIGLHITPFRAQINQCIMSTNAFIKRPTLWLIKAQQHGATILGAPNFGYKLVLTAYKPKLAEDWDLSQVRLIYNGAEPISIEICRQFLDVMAAHKLPDTAIYNVYGLAEGSVAVTFPNLQEGIRSMSVDRDYVKSGEQVRIVSGDAKESVTFAEVGYAIDHVEVRIADDNAQASPERTVGRIQIRGRSVTSGYYRNAEATSKALLSDGWLDTGDLGFMSDGRLYITGRIKDIIFVNGRNYYPHDIERVAEEVDDVELGKVAAVGVHNAAEHREDIIVFIQYKKKLEQFVEVSLALKKHINMKMGLELAHVFPVRTIPKTTSGKVQRYVLGDMFLKGQFAEMAEELAPLYEAKALENERAQPRNATEKAVMDIWSELLPSKRLSIYDNFFEVGGSSSLLLQMVDLVEMMYPGAVQITDPFALPTIAQIAAHIDAGSKLQSLGTLRLPQSYFLAANSISHMVSLDGRLQDKIQDEQWQRLRRLAKELNVSLMSVGAVAFAYTLSLIGEELKLPVSVHLRRNWLTEYEFDFNGVSDLAHYVQSVNQELRQSETRQPQWTIDQVKGMQPGTDEQSVRALFCDASVLRTRGDWQAAYDIVVAAEEKDSYFGITLAYNEQRLQASKLEEWMASYMQLLQFMAQSASNGSADASHSPSLAGGGR